MQRFHRAVAVLAAAAVLATAAPSLAQGFDVKTHTLKNGMKILVQEDHSIPNVALYIFLPRGVTQRAPWHHGHFALLRTHDVQRREEVRPG
jgi:hypothetical protein